MGTSSRHVGGGPGRPMTVALAAASAACLLAALFWYTPPVASDQPLRGPKTIAAAGAGQLGPVEEAAPGLEAPTQQTTPTVSALPGHGGVAAAPSAPSAVPPTTASVTYVRYGPIPLPPAVGGVPSRTVGGAPVFPMPCTNCYITGTTIDLVYEDGRSANLDTGVMLHHLVLAQGGRRDTTCADITPIGRLGQRFFAAGNERTSGTLPAGFGYHFGEAPAGAAFDIMNHSDTPKVVYLAASVSYLPDTTPGIKPVTPVWLDMNNCSTSEYQVPAGPSHRTWRWTSTITGRVLAAGGHVHDGGIKTVLSNQTTGQHLCTSYATYGTKPEYQGSVDSMSVCSWDRLGTVRAGEVLALDTYYNMAEPRSDVMGIMIAYVYETEDLEGGSPPPPPQSPPPGNESPPAPRHRH